MFERAVAGIGHYGNCVGVPNVGGETVFDTSYADNCLVNAMCVGLLPTERVLKAQARGTGNVVLLYGATTGRDGIGGASVLASQELGEEDADKRPSVQVGDPFTGKKLIESSLELVERDLVVSLQDCGAAGLASSLAEMARGGGGIDVHLDRVPLREEEMEPWEIMISESQERMVAVVQPREPGRGRGGLRPLGARPRRDRRGDRDTVSCARIYDGRGRRGDPGRVPHRRGAALRGRAGSRGSPPEPAPAPSRPAEPRRRCSSCSSSPNLRSRAWVYRRYDQLVGSRTIRRPGLDAAVLRLRPVVPRARGQPRRLRPGRPPRPAHRRRAGRARGRAERRLRRWRAARDHRLPQLRQSREAGDRLGARRGDRGHVRRLRGARHPGRLGQRLALQRHRRTLDPPDAGRRLRRARPRRPRSSRTRGARATRSTSPASPSSRSTAPSTRRSTASSKARPAPLDLATEAATRSAAPRARAALLAGPRRLGRRPRRRARRGGDRERDRRGARPARRCARPLRRRRRTGGPRLERGAAVPPHRHASRAIRSSLFRSRTCGRPTR